MITKIIVEGPNNVGKTTLINKLKSIYGLSKWEVIHCTNETPNTYEYFNELLSSERKIIFDRAFVGERIYPMLENRKSKLSKKDYYKLLINDYNESILHIFVFADEEFIKNAYLQKSEKYDDEYVRCEMRFFYDEYTLTKELCKNVLRID